FLVFINLLFRPFVKFHLVRIDDHMRKFTCLCNDLIFCIQFFHYAITFSCFTTPRYSPSSDHVFASVIFTSTISPITDRGALKLTNLFFSVYPERTSGFFLLSPSTSTFTTFPLYGFIASAER